MEFLANKKRFLVAGALAPLIVPTLFFIGVAFFSGYTDQGSGYIEKLIQLTLRGVIPLSYLASFLGGIPIIVLLYRIGKLTTLNCAAFAAAIGALGGYLIPVLFTGPGGFQPSVSDLFLAVLGGFVAIAVAITFCLISGIPAWERPKQA